jgi:hypothetical protein
MYMFAEDGASSKDVQLDQLDSISVSHEWTQCVTV